MFIGLDGMLHAADAKGGGAARAKDAGRRDDTKNASWAQGGRSGQAPERRTDPAAEQPPRQRPKELRQLADGKVRLLGGADGTLQLWGTPKPPAPGQPVGPPVPMRVFHGHVGRVTAAAVSPAGRYIVSADATGRLLAWDLLRPLHGWEFEVELRKARERFDANPADPEALSILAEWFAFRGRDVVRP
jgi:hypothetical protein